jgi:repressor LexA
MNGPLIELIDARLAALSLSDRKASMKAGLHPDAIRGIRRGATPRIDRLQALAPVLGVSFEQLAALAAKSDNDKPEQAATAQSVKAVKLKFETIYVLGSVQAGNWKQAVEWPSDEWIPLSIPMDPRHQNAKRFALQVRGKSMDLLYPSGTILICARYNDINVHPTTGDKVICLRRDKETDGYEATVKEYQATDDGRVILWPRSSQPEFQFPIVLTEEPHTSADFSMLTSMDVDLNGSTADIVIIAKVIQSVRLE